MPLVYLAGPIKGLFYDEAIKWRDSVQSTLSMEDIACLSPMRCREEQAGTRRLNQKTCKKNCMTTAKAIVARDLNDVMRCDLLFANFLGSSTASIGTVFELGYAYALRKPIVVAIDVGSVYDHCFVTEPAGFITHSIDESIKAIVSILKYE